MTTLVPEMLWDGACALEAEPQTVRRIRFPGFTRERAKRDLKSKGWSYRRAAERLGRSYQHLSEVLNGHRTSRRLLSEIASLPPSSATKPKRTTK